MKTLVFLVAFVATSGAGGEDFSSPASLLRFTLTETPATVRRLMGEDGYMFYAPKATIIDFRNASSDLDDDPMWHFYFQDPGEHLLVVTHNFEKPADVSALFSAPGSQRRFFPNKEKPTLTVLVRNVDKNRVLVALMQKPDSMMAGQILLTTPAHSLILFPFLAP